MFWFVFFFVTSACMDTRGRAGGLVSRHWQIHRRTLGASVAVRGAGVMKLFMRSIRGVLVMSLLGKVRDVRVLDVSCRAEPQTTSSRGYSGA
ncbi:hypothetical protein F5X68DRAFT_213312 [Plectosphaerella plurivora]|uniref:Secreted protein n=1 Tax=Plectosphaerella plurivora TaxID=936078 RepID=A0A9P9A9C2_9PEZI|nr:hypothetical protein F5X68DRAFT_213312 [Plectosphaerella plurivora]